MPHPTNRRVPTWTAAPLLAILLTAPASAQTVITDYPDYYPGETVVITGAGWWPGEVVSLRLDQHPTLHEPYVFTSTADSTGAFRNSDYVVEDQDLGTSFDLVATGLSSGLVATTFFTDSPKVGSVLVGDQSGAMCSTTGGTATYSITVSRGSGGGSSGAFTAALTASGLPSGVTAAFSPNPVSFTPGQTFRSSTLTLTSPGTDPGATGFTVRAATSASDVATQAGLLQVNEPPSIVCPAPITRTNDPGQCGAIVSFTVSAAGSPTPVVTVSPAPGTLFPIGTTTVTATATNSCGTATCSFTVTVLDNEVPSITVSDATFPTDAGACHATVASPGASAADNCAMASLVGTRGDGAALTDPFPQGTTTITWLATDASGNTAGATQYVMVADTEHPTMTAPASLTLATGPGSLTCGVDVGNAALGTPVASDNCAVSVTVEGIPAGSFFPVGTTAITYTATDPSGNTAVATQTVTVVDDTPPWVSGGESIHETDPGSCGTTITTFGLAMSDNCGVASVTDARDDGLALGDPFPVGLTTITHTITDIHGNTATGTSRIVVEDHEAPRVAVPAAVQAVTGPGARVCGAVISDAALGQPAVTDNCSATLTRAGVPEGNLFPVGATTITWTATDPSGNATVVTQTVAVVDDTPPTLAVPPALTLATGPDATGCGLAVTDATLDVAAAEDNCSVVLIRTGVPDGHFFPIGTTTITYTATDPSGNTVSATQLVTVTDATPPRITVADLTRPTDAGLCAAAITDLGASAADHCGTASFTGVRGDGLPLGDPYPKGATAIVWTATDDAGNTSSATQTVTVTNSSPSAEITGPASGIVIAVGTPVSLTGTFTDDAGDVHTAAWTCDALTCTAVVDESSRSVSGTMTFAAAGVYRVRLVVADQCGASSEATQVAGLDAMVVVYDPNAGFVTGGGWIQSPPGAYAASPSLTGKANFGFVSKYKRGATTPTGDTEFQFKAGDLNFHSSTYEWLVIAGARAQYKGTGTINGGGSYGFLLSAVDGQTPGGGGADKFRIKITDKTSGVVVYDNMMGAADSSAAATLLGGGSIAVQTNGGKASASIGASMTGPEGAAPAANGLAQNRPNPFNPETTIRFTLARAGRATLRVFDARGRLVRTLVEAALREGAHEARWNGLDDRGGRVTSGVYYALFAAADGYRDRVRMVLVK